MTDQETKRLIMARRARFLAVAMAAAGFAALPAQGCSGKVEQPGPDQGTGGATNDADASPQPCLTGGAGGAPSDAQPEACLSPPYDAAGAGGVDAAPTVCLSGGAYPDADYYDSEAEAEPQPCLEPPLDDASAD